VFEWEPQITRVAYDVCIAVADSDGDGGGKEVAALTEKKMGRSLPPVNTITYTVRDVHLLKRVLSYSRYTRISSKEFSLT
jgi:hypothetical protein